MTLRSGSKFRFRPKLIFSSRKLRDAASNSRAIAAMAHDPSDDASLLRPALEFMIAAGTKGEPNEDVDDGAAYQDDYADILVEEAENRYKDILDYRDYEYGDEVEYADAYDYADDNYEN